MENKNRLTESDDLGNWGVKGLPWKNLYTGEVITRKIHEKLYGCLAKLKDYEETELTPKEVEDVASYIKLASENNCAESILENLMKYKEIGTVEEFRRLKERYTPKAAVITGHNNSINTDIGECPNCNGLPLRACDFKYCPECGQRLDWSAKNG